jgi:hypothetical protein
LLLGLARAVTLRSKSRRTHGLILLSQLRLHTISSGSCQSTLGNIIFLYWGRTYCEHRSNTSYTSIVVRIAVTMETFVYKPFPSNFSPIPIWNLLAVKVTLRSTVSRPVRLGVRSPSGTRDQFFFLLEIFFRQLRVCYFVAPSLTRGRVCHLPVSVYSQSVFCSAFSDERSGLSFASISL